MEAPKHLDSAPKMPQENFTPEVVNLALSRMQTAAYKKRFDKLGITLKGEDFYTKAGLKTDNVGSLGSVNSSFGLSLRAVDISYSGVNEKYKIAAAKNNALVAILRWHLENAAKPVEAPDKSLDKMRSQIQQKIGKFQERINDVFNAEKEKPGTYTADFIVEMQKLNILFKDLAVKISKAADPKSLDNYATILEYNEKFLSLFGFGEVKPKVKKVEAVSSVKGRFSIDGEGRIALTDSNGNSFTYTVVKPQEITISATNSASTGAVLVSDGVTMGLMKQDVNGKWKTGGFDGKASIWDSYDVTFGSPIEIKKKFVPKAPVVKEVSKPKKSPEEYHGVLQYGSAEWKEWAESAEKVSNLIILAGDESGIDEARELKKTLGTGLSIVKVDGGRWCQPCNRVKPFMGEAEKKYAGKIKFFNAAVFGGAGSVIPFLFQKEYGVKGFPTFLVFKNGKLQEKIDDVRTFGLSGTQTAIDLDKTRALIKAKFDSL